MVATVAEVKDLLNPQWGDPHDVRFSVEADAWTIYWAMGEGSSMTLVLSSADVETMKASK